MVEKKDEEKIKLKYPCAWIYKIIGVDQGAMESAIGEIIQDRVFIITVSRRSAKGKYLSLNVEVTVESESHRQIIYESLRSHPAIKIVL